MAPATDEVASFQRRKGGNRYSSSGTTAHSNTGLYLIIVVLIAALGGGSYWGYTKITTLENQFTTAEGKLFSTLSTLTEVNEQLELTDQALNTSDGSVQSKLKLYDSEIRKLWGNYKKQRKLISTNKKSIDTAVANGKNLSKKLATATAQSNKADTTQELKVAETSQSVDKSVKELTSEIAKLRKQINTLSKQKKPTNLTAVNQKIQSNEEAIVAIDSFRVQTNRALDKLMKTVAKLEKQLDASPTP
ncbi:MAG: hypothetical protein KUG72_10005 [Pseudomonadales bacterium]|nr:hypothetical protein [Pseudomonadales bacterium]